MLSPCSQSCSVGVLEREHTSPLLWSFTPDSCAALLKAQHELTLASAAVAADSRADGPRLLHPFKWDVLASET